MIRDILNFAKKHLSTLNLGRTLELGALNVNGTIRDAARGASEYIGVDMRAGRDVDLVMDAADCLQTFGAASFDTILCCEMLEHDRRFWATVAGMHAMLRPGGHLLISTPTFGFPYHAYPKDYWRFSEDAYREFLFAGLDVIEIATLTDRRTTIAGIARKP